MSLQAHAEAIDIWEKEVIPRLKHPRLSCTFAGRGVCVCACVPAVPAVQVELRQAALDGSSRVPSPQGLRESELQAREATLSECEKLVTVREKEVALRECEARAQLEALDAQENQSCQN